MPPRVAWARTVDREIDEEERAFLDCGDAPVFTFAGDDAYMAPELLQPELGEVTCAADMFSLGASSPHMLNVMTGRAPATFAT